MKKWLILALFLFGLAAIEAYAAALDGSNNSSIIIEQNQVTSNTVTSYGSSGSNPGQCKKNPCQ